MKYMIAIETTQYVEVESETAEAAIESVKSQLDPRVAAAAHYSIVREMEEQQQEEKQTKGE